MVKWSWSNQLTPTQFSTNLQLQWFNTAPSTKAEIMCTGLDISSASTGGPCIVESCPLVWACTEKNKVLVEKAVNTWLWFSIPKDFRWKQINTRRKQSVAKLDVLWLRRQCLDCSIHVIIAFGALNLDMVRVGIAQTGMATGLSLPCGRATGDRS